MGRNAAWLSDKQIETLEWVRIGCPRGDPGGEIGRRIVARSLHRRGLIAIKGQGASWSASITDAGRAWQASHIEPRLGDEQVDQLIQLVVAAQGRWDLPDQGNDTHRIHKELVKMSDHSPNRPKGWRLEMRNAGSWSEPHHEVILVRHFDDLVEARPVPVPTRVARYHPSVKAFVADRDWHQVSREHMDRAAHILQAIVDEAPRRGLDVLSATQVKSAATDTYQTRAAERCRLGLRSPAGVYGIRIQEVSAPGGKRVEPRYRNQRRTRAAWLDARHTEFATTGILELTVEGPGMAFSGERFRDAKTISVEDKLPRAFRAIEIHRLQSEWRAQGREREAVERHHRWEAAMAEARDRYVAQFRWEAFVQRSDDWRDVARHREFLAAARSAVDRYDGPMRDHLTAQLAFAEDRLDGIDPLGHLDLMLPDVPEPKPGDLKAYLHGWSPHGPEVSGW